MKVSNPRFELKFHRVVFFDKREHVAEAELQLRLTNYGLQVCKAFKIYVPVSIILSSNLFPSIAH